MIPFKQAFDMVMNSVRQLDSERVPLAEAANRVLAEDVRSDMDMPPFNKSAMDGFACRRKDLPCELTIVETIQAGCLPTRRVGTNQCSRIMTGAMVPEGADCVIMLEQTDQVSETAVRFVGADTRDNICCRGEDFRANEVVLHKGDRIAAPHIAVMASVGHVRPCVSRRPRVAVIATGDELVEPEEQPQPSQIRTSNGYQLCAQAAAMGAVPHYYGIVRDTEEAIDRALRKAMTENDVILLSAGVSKGDYDFVPAVMRKNHIDILFDSIAVKPGKPTTFGIGPDTYCFGLPGNPVSTFIQFEILVKPFLFSLMGHGYRAPQYRLPLAQAVDRRPGDRDTWMPVKVTEDGRARLIEYHGSAHIKAFCEADGILMIPAATESLDKGTIISVRPI